MPARTDTFLGERYRRIARRRGKKKAIVAVGRSILVIVWHLLSDPEARFTDLGPDFYDTRINPERQQAQPRPPTRSPRLQRHPRARRLTTTSPVPHPAPPPRQAGGPARPSPTRFSDQNCPGGFHRKQLKQASRTAQIRSAALLRWRA